MEEVNMLNRSDAKMHQEYPKFPNGQSTLKMITPATKMKKILACFDIKDGDKMTNAEKANAHIGTFALKMNSIS